MISQKNISQNYKKLEITYLLKEIEKELKEALLNAKLETNGVPIELATSTTGFGGKRYWFKCPNCGNRCGVLYQGLNQNLHCRKCL